MLGITYIDDMLHDCLKRPKLFNKSDYEYLVQLSADWKRLGCITKNHIERLEKLWERID